MADTVIDLTGLAAATTTDPGATPNFGLAFDLASGQWVDANQFREFIRAQQSVTQQRVKQETLRLNNERLRELELQRARNYEQGGLFKTDEELNLHRDGVGNQIMTGFKAIGSYGGQLFDHILDGGNRGDSDELEDLDKAYAKYAKKGGLLTRQEFDSFADGTKLMILEKGALGEFGRELLEVPGMKAALKAADKYAYRPAIAFTEIMLDPDHAEWNALFSRKHWNQAFKEAYGESLGNALVDGVFENAGASDATLDRWKRENPWYQMSSVGAEFAVAWYADPLVLGGKAAAGAKRLKRNELPVKTGSRQSIAIRQRLTGQEITALRNPLSKAYASFRAHRIEDAQKGVEDFIREGATVADLTRLPMYQSRGRVVDGGLAASIKHYAVTKQDELNRALNSPAVRDAMAKPMETPDGMLPAVEMPEHLDILDLTWRMEFGDAQAWAMFQKLQHVSPDELMELAPGAGELIDRVNALRTKHDTLQQEVDDLLADKEKWEAGEPPSMFHRWEVDTSLEIQQKQLAETSDALQRYDGYKDFLADVVDNKPHLSRVSRPTGKRWSQVRDRQRDPELTETRHIFQSSFYGKSHSFTRIPRTLFLQRANTAELHNVDSTIMSVNRTWNQLAHLYRYNPEGVRDSYIERLIGSKDEYERYRIFHEMEEDHFAKAVATRFEIDEAVARTIIQKIDSERNASIQGILRGDNYKFGTAPTLGQRAVGADPNVSLLSRDADTGMVRIRVMQGQHMEEYEVPQEALFQRLGPEDVTQLPNYYNPLDHRRIFYQLKHDKQMLDELQKGYVTRGAAALADAGQWAGTMFNKFWKPYQLFRAAWPMRVLMDEGMRAMAVMGPMYWLKNDGMEAALRTLPATANLVANKASKLRHGPIGVSMASTAAAQRKYAQKNLFARDHEVRTAAVTLPEELYPRLNGDRYARALGISQEWHGWNTRHRADRDWYAKRYYRHDGSKPLPENPTDLQRRLDAHGRDRAHRFESLVDHGERPAHPALKIYQSVFDARLRGGKLDLIEKPKVYDPISGNEVRSGYFVPTTEAFNPTAGDDLGLVNWYQQNAELLSRQGMRIMAQADPETGAEGLVIGRWFSGGTRNGKYRQAREFAEYVSEKNPNTRLWHLHRPGHYDEVAEADASPTRLAMHRYFSSEETLELHRTEGAAAPMTGRDGGKEVYHGTSSPDGLPEQLSPRDDVPSVQGNMIGKGLYTTLSREIAESYGQGEFPFVVMNSRTGQKYKPFDLDQVITPEAERDLYRWLRNNSERFGFSHHAFPSLAQVQLAPYFVTATKDGTTWANLYESISSPDFHKALHAYMEERGAGVLTHKGGTTHGHPHQVYVWLHPEDLVVKPLYTETSRFIPFARWIDQHDDFTPVENYLPENQIIRKKPEQEPIAALPEGSNPERGELRAREREALDVEGMDMTSFDFKLDSPYGWLMNKIRDLAEQGVGYRTIKSSDGTEVKVESAFNGHSGQLFRALASSNGVLDVLSEGHGSGTSLFRRKSEGWRTYNPPKFTDQALNPKSIEHKKAVRYFQVYADTINDHLGNSPIIQRMIAGWDDDRLIDWLDDTPQGAKIRDQVKPEGLPTGLWVEEFRGKLNYYVPNKMLQRLLGKGRLAPSDFRKHIADEDLPTIYGPDFEVLDKRRGAGQLLNDFADKMFHAFGTVPIDRLSRHPFAKSQYDAKMRELIGMTKGKWLDQNMIEHYQDVARAHAMNEVKRTLYTLLDVNNMTDALRFVAPFWGAQYEAITKWLRIISDRPETVARFFAGQRAVYENFMVVDQDGNKKDTAIREGGLHDLGLYQPEDMVVMPLPGFIKKKFPGLENYAQTRIPIGSANTVLQGELPLFPGLGPLVTVPADLFLKEVSKTYGVENDEDLLYRWLFPVGRPRSEGTFARVMEQTSPGWSRRIQQASGSQNMVSRLNMEMQIGREMRLRAERDGKPAPTAEEISKAADWMYGLRVATSFISPVQVQYMPQHQYWVDAYHKMEKDFGPEAWDKFVERYGEEAAIYAISSSESVGVPSTSRGMEEWSKSDKLIAKYPEWTSAIISPEAWMDEFSSDAYGQQFNIPLGPGATKKLRETTSVQDRLETEPEIRLGWREYRKLSAAIEAELANRGLNSIQQKDAEGLRLYKRDMVKQIVDKYPAWAEQYHQRDDNVYDRVAELQQFAFDRRFDHRPDFRGIRDYLTIRQQVVNRLEEWAAQGGSPSLQSEQNGMLRGWFYEQVGQLILDNPAFAEFYTRYLESDTLELGGGGY